MHEITVLSNRFEYLNFLSKDLNFPCLGSDLKWDKQAV